MYVSYQVEIRMKLKSWLGSHVTMGFLIFFQIFMLKIWLIFPIIRNFSWILKWKNTPLPLNFPNFWGPKWQNVLEKEHWTQGFNFLKT